jgi:hypothetical protein
MFNDRSTWQAVAHLSLTARRAQSPQGHERSHIILFWKSPTSHAFASAYDFRMKRDSGDGLRIAPRRYELLANRLKEA